MNIIDLVTAGDPVSSQVASDEDLARNAPTAAAVLRLAGEELPVRGTQRRRLRWAIPVGAALLAGAAAAAANLATSAPATVSNLVRCYSVGQLTTNVAQYTDTSMASSPGHPATDESASARAAIGACAGLWQTGFIRPGTVGANTNQNGHFQVPGLVACVLQDGRAAVLPGNGQTCRDLGLPDLAAKAGR